MGRNSRQKVDEHEEEILELKHTRQVVSDRLHRFKNFLIDHSEEIFQVESRLKSVEDDFSDFDRIQTRLEFLSHEEKNTRLSMESSFYEVIACAKEIIANSKVEKIDIGRNSLATSMIPHPAQVSSIAGVGAVAKLPDLGLPSFHGNYESWYSFIDIFDSVVHNRTDLSEIEKFLYLKICCKNDALKLVESLDVTAKNYSIALDLLRKRYENKRAIINFHVNNILFNLPHVTKESSIQLRKLLDCLHQHRIALEKLKLPVEHWDLLLIPIILQKIDDRTRREWENKQSDQNLPKLTDLVDFLTKKCFTLEAINTEFSSRTCPNFTKDRSREFIEKPFQRKFKSFHVMESQTGNQATFIENQKCFICNDKHFIYQCPKFTNLSIAEKYSEIRKHKLCSNCLRQGHFKTECRSRGCKKCNAKHNTSLHVHENYQGNLTQSDNVAIGHDPERDSVLRQERHRGPTHGEAASALVGGNSRETARSADITRTTIHMTTENDPNNFSRKERDLNLKHESENSDNTTNDLFYSGSYSSVNAKEVLLSTAAILIQDNQGAWHKCNALLDSGSQSNLITQSLCKKLNLKCEKINIPLAGINQAVTNISSRTNAEIKSRFTNFKTNLSFLVLPRITEKLPLGEFHRSVLKIPENVRLADENFNVPKEIDLLLGAGIFFDLLGCGKIKLGNNMPVLQETCLGWVLTGNLNFQHNFGEKIVCNISKISNEALNDSLVKFWQIEDLDHTNFQSSDEQYCEEYFRLTTTRDTDGKFIVKYPFKLEFENKLGNSKTNALKRFENLEKRLEKNTGLKSQYLDFMHEYNDLGHMTLKHNLESDKSIEDSAFFLPHTAVLKDSVTTKCRVVFDASAKTDTDVSFNDTIMVGPTIQHDLFSILLRLRLKNYVLSADIKMMYRCIWVHPSERSFQQILWRWNRDEPIKVYQLNTVTYGTSSAPFQATRCLKELALLNKEKYPRSAKIIEDSFYMDDLLLSVDSEQEAIEIYHELTDILSQSKFELRKWSSNEKIILQHILENSESNDENLVLFHDKKELKTLGITWDANNDILKYTINLKYDEFRVTKRTVLSAISQIFDPLGLIGPAVIKAKLLIQQLWQLQLDWDQEIPEHLKAFWTEFASSISLLNNIAIDRQVLASEVQAIELYGFSDSSEKAYGACVYLGSMDRYGNKTVRLLTAKSKVAPLKKQTLPRLELLAAHLLAELVHKIKNILDIDIDKTFYFTDSTIVLAWLKTEPYKLKTFVANRIAKITEVSDIKNWSHVKSSENAADIISRGLNPKELLESNMWFHGPGFLKNDLSIIGVDKVVAEVSSDMLPELKHNTLTLNVMDLAQQNESKENVFNIFERYSTLTKLRRVVAYILRFKNRCLKTTSAETRNLTTKELNEALFCLIRLAQFELFKTEITNLKKNRQIGNNSKILNLNPFLDSSYILRVGGRLSNAEIDYDQQHPIILPYNNKLTDLIVFDAHLKYLHAGYQTLLSILRLKYWPVKGKNIVKRVIKSCIVCFRVNPKPAQYLMGSLPRSRVTSCCRPFTNSGVDYAGPVYVKDGTLRRSKLVKTYICIFICFSTRAVHIELVPDLTTNSFLNALKRFCSRRGRPSDIYSDNGLNFIGANNYFKELYDLINNKKHNESVSSFLAADEIKWHFIPARSASFGGLWEAAVKSMKFHLRRVLGESSLNFEEMYTLLVQIESVLNSRPLTPISNDINDHLSLTPSHFLIGDSLMSTPQDDLTEVPISRLNRYQRLQQLYQQFWARWSREYLAQMQTRSKWRRNPENPVKEGALIVLVEDNLPPLKWPLARVVQLHPGLDKVVRVVSVRLPSGTVTKRSLTRVCVLPIE